MANAMGNIKQLVEVNNIIGTPISTPDGLTLVPVTKVSFGFGGAGGKLQNSKEELSGGSAGGVKIEPIGFLAVNEGNVRMVNVLPPAKNSVDRILDLVPQVIEKIEQIKN